MKHPKLLFKFLTLSFFFGLAETARANTVAPLYVVIGGFHSCAQVDGDEPSPYRNYMWPMYKNRVSDALKSEVEVDAQFILTCYGVSMVGNSSLAEIDFRLESSFGEAEEQRVQGLFSSLDANDFSAIVNSLVSRVESYASAHPGANIYIVGHSFGGWTSLKLTLRLLADKVPVRILYTIDPISPLHCNPQEYLRAGIYTVPGCREAPSDITHEERIAIRDGLGGNWRNFYQTQFHRLQSGPIPELSEPGQSTRLQIPSPSAIYNDQHTLISKDPRIWDFIGKNGVKDFANQ